NGWGRASCCGTNRWSVSGLDANYAMSTTSCDTGLTEGSGSSPSAGTDRLGHPTAPETKPAGYLEWWRRELIQLKREDGPVRPWGLKSNDIWNVSELR